MGKLAFLFAGQGAQAPGMGKSLYERGGKAAETFDVVEQVRPGTLEDCFSGSAERLKMTSVTQPCLYAVDLACAAALAELGFFPDAAAGFSLGEVAALTFCGAFLPQKGAEVVCRRGELMQQAAEKHPGAMAAVLRLSDDVVEGICQRFENLWPVNYNCPGQLVVSGDEAVMQDFAAAVKEAGGMAKILPVGGPFHTPYMKEAAAEFAPVLAAAGMAPTRLPVYANFTAKPYGHFGAPYEETLAAQMHSPVRWSAILENLADEGFDTFVEVGPGKTLSGFVKRTVKDALVLNVEDEESLLATAKALKNAISG